MLSIHYLVLSSKGGTQMDIGMTLKVGSVALLVNCDDEGNVAFFL